MKGKLNENQLNAVNFTSGNLLIMASAGTGKTTTIVERYVNMIQNHGYRSDEILMTTFTNKAAEDMLKKIVERTGEAPPYIGTMHSLFLRFLRDNYSYVGLDRNFTILDDGLDKRKIIVEILKKEKIDSTPDNIKYFTGWIGKFKNRGIISDNLSDDYSLDDNIREGIVEEALDDEVIRVKPLMRKFVNRIYKRYEEELKKRNVVDFDDIMLLTYKLFEENEDIRTKYSNKFKSIMVDEAQDLNVVQKNILNLLKNDNLCLIGDDCQNIYEWRGSSSQLVFDFNENEKAIILEENYRSGKKIIEAVNKTIDSLNIKIDKNLKQTKEHDGSVAIESFLNFSQELDFIVSKVNDLISNDTPPEDIAILFRTNNIGKNIEIKFRNEKIPYYSSKTFDFFRRGEIRDIRSFLNLKINPNSVSDFERVFGLIPGLGKVTIDRIKELSSRKNCSLVEALSFCNEIGIKSERSSHLLWLKKVLEDFKKNPVESFLDDFGYKQYLSNKNGDSREKLSEKFDYLQSFNELLEEYPCSKEGINDFLDSLIELGKKDKTSGRVFLTTIHGAKGLEWKHVFLVSCNERTLPFYRGELSNLKKDSELRLFYVAISRAKDSLVISNSEEGIFGNDSERSQFVDIIE